MGMRPWASPHWDPLSPASFSINTVACIQIPPMPLLVSSYRWILFIFFFFSITSTFAVWWMQVDCGLDLPTSHWALKLANCMGLGGHGNSKLYHSAAQQSCTLVAWWWRCRYGHGCARLLYDVPPLFLRLPTRLHFGLGFMLLVASLIYLSQPLPQPSIHCRILLLHAWVKTGIDNHHIHGSSLCWNQGPSVTASPPSTSNLINMFLFFRICPSQKKTCESSILDLLHSCSCCSLLNSFIKLTSSDFSKAASQFTHSN